MSRFILASLSQDYPRFKCTPSAYQLRKQQEGGGLGLPPVFETILEGAGPVDTNRHFAVNSEGIECNQAIYVVPQTT